MHDHTRLVRLIARILMVLSPAFAVSVRADVTVEQKNSLNVASVIRMHGSSTESITSDKQRKDTESHCEGFMSMVCGNLQGAEIVRLDRGLTWELEPKKQRYREQPFATPQQLAEMRAKMQANLEKMRACPTAQAQAPLDKSKCQMSAPKIDVRKTDDTASIAGHNVQRTAASLTQSCTDKETGDVCDTVIALDVWLTQDSLAGSEERIAFQKAYAKKLGLDDMLGTMRGEVDKFLGPYQAQIKQLAAKSKDFKGQALKTSFRVLFGGQQCGAATKMKQQTASSDGGTALDAAQAGRDAGMSTAQSAADGAAQNAIGRSAGSSIGGAIAGSAVGASVSKLMGGLFNRKKSQDPQVTAGAPSVDKTPDPYPQMLQVAQFTVETVSIDTGAIAAERFDVPAGWTKEIPKPGKAADEHFTCPKSGA